MNKCVPYKQFESIERNHTKENKCINKGMIR